MNETRKEAKNVHVQIQLGTTLSSCGEFWSKKRKRDVKILQSSVLFHWIVELVRQESTSDRGQVWMTREEKGYC